MSIFRIALITILIIKLIVNFPNILLIYEYPISGIVSLLYLFGFMGIMQRGGKGRTIGLFLIGFLAMVNIVLGFIAVIFEMDVYGGLGGIIGASVLLFLVYKEHKRLTQTSLSRPSSPSP